MEFYVLAIIGVLIHFFKKLYEARESNTKTDFVLEGIATVIALLIVIGLIYSKEDLENLYPITKVTAIVLGYSSHSIFKSIVKAVNPEKK